MPALSKIVSLFALALSASALTTPHVARGFNEHHALLARKAAPEPMNEVRVVKPKRLRRRADSGRCSDIASSTSSSLVASSTSSPISSSSSSTWSDSSSSSTAQLATAVQNVAFSSSVEVAATTTWSSSSSVWTAEPTTSSSSWSTEIDITSSSSSIVSSIFGTFFSGTNAGDGTYYTPGLGACGITNTEADYIAAAAYGMFDTVPGYNGNPNDNPVCGKSVVASYGGKSVTVQITDRCAGCTNENSLDFSPAAFQQLADESVGRISIDWVWA